MYSNAPLFLFITFLYYTSGCCKLLSLNGTDDEVVSLPGLTAKLSYRQYSGFLDVTNGRHFHYWFVESQSNPLQDPVVLWLNGGPGCSSLIGLFTENGPFRVIADEETVVEDAFSWNQFANVLFLESPAGVGFSYQDNDNYDTNDDQTALDNYRAVLQFFQKFPQFRENNFYITGESYAGVYVPMLTLQILRDRNSLVNLKGIAIGNGYVDSKLLYNSKVYYAYYHGLIDSKMWTNLVNNCCDCGDTGLDCNFAYFNDTTDEERNNTKCIAGYVIRRKMFKAGINPYFIYDDCQPFDENAQIMHTRYYHDIKRYFRLELESIEAVTEYYSKNAERPKCVGESYIKWLNTVKVREALNIPNHLPIWHPCTNISYDVQYDSMRDNFLEIIRNYQLDSFILYNGDSDLVCDFLGVQAFVDSLSLTVVDEYRAWKYDSQTAGFVKRFDGLSLINVRGAGHMVPTNKPGAALKILAELVGKSKL